MRSTLRPSPPVEFDLERFERVTVGSGALLLRVAGHWRSAAPLDLGPASLVVADGETTHRLDALPGPDARGARPWRAAFAAPPDLLDGSFSLHAGDLVVQLPPPVEHELASARAREEPTRRRGGDEAREEVGAARAEVAALSALVEALRSQLEALELSAVDVQTQVDERLETAQAEASAERARAERLEFELERARAELGALRDGQAQGRAASPPPRPVAKSNGKLPARPPSPRPHAPIPSWLPAEWVVALALLAVGVAIVLIVWTGALF